MIKKLLLKTIALFVIIAAFAISSCSGYEGQHWPPYVGCKWYSPCGNDTLFFELVSAHDAVLRLSGNRSSVSCGRYNTHRLKFVFEDFYIEYDSVLYHLDHARHDAGTRLMLCGDSLDMRRDSEFSLWSRGFLSVE